MGRVGAATRAAQAGSPGSCSHVRCPAEAQGLETGSPRSGRSPARGPGCWAPARSAARGWERARRAPGGGGPGRRGRWRRGGTAPSATGKRREPGCGVRWGVPSEAAPASGAPRWPPAARPLDPARCSCNKRSRKSAGTGLPPSVQSWEGLGAAPIPRRGRGKARPLPAPLLGPGPRCTRNHVVKWLSLVARQARPLPPPRTLSCSYGAMKLNERSVTHYALSNSPADHVGFLRTWGVPGTPPTTSGTGRRCWFVLKGNLLFSFESREGRAPLGLVVLEGCTVELAEAPVPEEFAFTIRFSAPAVRPYLLAADGPAAQEAWVKALSRASFGYMRLVVRELENQLRDARQSLALQRHSSWKAVTSPSKTQAPDHLSCGLENGHSLSRDCSPMGLVEVGASRPAGQSLAGCELQGPTSFLLGRGQSPVSPETSCFSTLHAWYGQEILELRRGWLQRARGSQPKCEQQDKP